MINGFLERVGLGYQVSGCTQATKQEGEYKGAGSPFLSQFLIPSLIPSSSFFPFIGYKPNTLLGSLCSMLGVGY